MYAKPVDGTATRNVWAARAHKAALIMPLADGAGTAIDNFGTRSGAPWDSPTLSGSTSWVLTDEGVVVRLSTAGTPGRLTLATAGTQLVYPRGELICRFAYPAGGQGPVFSTGAETAGSLSAIRTGNLLTVQLYDGAIAVFPVEDLTPYTLTVSWGEKGFYASLMSDAGPIETSSITLIDRHLGLTIESGQVIACGRHLSTFADLDLYTFNWLDWQLKPKERYEHVMDPYLLGRPMPTSLFATDVGPITVRTTKVQTLSHLVTATGLSGTAYFRIRYGTDPYLRTYSESTVWTADAATALSQTLYGLTAGTKYYWHASYSSDGVNFIPFPGGVGWFTAQRDPGDPYEWVYITDTHFGGETWGGLGHFSDTNTSQQRLSFALYDIFNKDYDFILMGGDDWYPDAGTNGTALQKIIRYRQFMHRGFKTCTVFHMIGNHECESGYHQDSVDSGNLIGQRTATILRKRFLPNPLPTTYPEGGENEGNQTNPNGNDWVPALSDQFPQTYRDTQIGDGSDGNGSPLENYYAFTWGDLLMIVTDIERYSAVGEANIGTRIATHAPWRYGPTQMAWIRQVAVNSLAMHKALATHHSAGGVRTASAVGGWYGRGDNTHVSDRRLTIIDHTAHERASSSELIVPGSIGILDELEMNRIIRLAGINVKLQGHDHKSSFTTNRQGVNCIIGMTGKSVNQFSNTTDFNDIYGSPESNGVDRAYRGVRRVHCGYGYTKFRVSSSHFFATVRMTSVPAATGTESAQSSVSPFVRFVGHETTGVDGVIQVAEVPDDVLCVCAAADGAYSAANPNPPIQNAATFQQINKYNWGVPDSPVYTPFTGPGATVAEEPYGEPVVYYNTNPPYGGPFTGVQAVRVSYVPCDLYTAQLLPAKPFLADRLTRERSVPEALSIRIRFTQAMFVPWLNGSSGRFVRAGEVVTLDSNVFAGQDGSGQSRQMRSLIADLRRGALEIVQANTPITHTEIDMPIRLSVDLPFVAPRPAFLV